ncbi:MAG: hypothetical protein KDN19_22480, partial [Verrucomicrobiae bacterium]|nr:hypothetical protein [Verrucomicrobiae bacterium]
VTYSIEEGSVSEGLGKTFDGDHPCPLCHAVEKASQENDSPEAPPLNESSKLKVEICQATRVQLFSPHDTRLPAGQLDLHGTTRHYSPDGPPPEAII